MAETSTAGIPADADAQPDTDPPAPTPAADSDADAAAAQRALDAEARKAAERAAVAAEDDRRMKAMAAEHDAFSTAEAAARLDIPVGRAARAIVRLRDSGTLHETGTGGIYSVTPPAEPSPDSDGDGDGNSDADAAATQRALDAEARKAAERAAVAAADDREMSALAARHTAPLNAATAAALLTIPRTRAEASLTRLEASGVVERDGDVWRTPEDAEARKERQEHMARLRAQSDPPLGVRARDVATVLAGLGVTLIVDRRTQTRLYSYDPAEDRTINLHEPWARPPLAGDGSRWAEVTDETQAAWRDAAAEYWTKETKQGLDSQGNQRVSRQPWRLADTDWRLAIDAICHEAARRRDLFLDWIDSLDEWDGTERVETLLADALGADADDLSAWGGRTLLAGALARAHEPGQALHEHLVLIDPKQGIGKSLLLKSLVPHRDWHQTIRLDLSDKELIEGTIGKVIVEIDEMDGARRAEVTRIKSLLTSEAATVRLAYRRDPVTVRRDWVAVGTSNDAEALPHDPSGHRRFVAVPCAGGKMDGPKVGEWVAERREQLWAEARDRRAAGEPDWQHGRLPAALKAEQAQRNTVHAQHDPTLDDKLNSPSFRDWLRRARASGTETFPVAEIACRVGMQSDPEALLDRPSAMRLADALTDHGWTRERPRIDGRRQRRWRPPPGAAADTLADGDADSDGEAL